MSKFLQKVKEILNLPHDYDFKEGFQNTMLGLTEDQITKLDDILDNTIVTRETSIEEMHVVFWLELLIENNVRTS